MKSCSIVVRTLNEGKHLGSLAEGIRNQEYPQELIDLIMVDSGSTDNTLSIAENAGARILHLKRSEFSFGRSLNVGCDAATGEILVFVSGHCVPTNKEWLKRLINAFTEPSVSIAYGRQIGGPETRFSEHAIFGKYFPACAQNHHQSPFFCNNANLALRRECWAAYRFDESLTGLEDMHLARQLYQKKKHIIYVPEACVYHYHNESWRQVKRRYEREAIALREIMPEVHIHWHDAVRYFAAGVLGDWSRALQQNIFLKSAAEVVAFRFCQFYGAWRGNHAHRNLSRQQKDRYFFPN